MDELQQDAGLAEEVLQTLQDNEDSQVDQYQDEQLKEEADGPARQGASLLQEIREEDEEDDDDEEEDEKSEESVFDREEAIERYRVRW